MFQYVRNWSYFHGLDCYRNIEELHEQNQKLLLVVRELSEAQEEKEMETGDKKLVIQSHFCLAA